MSVQLQLDRPHAHFTNLDVVTGKVILKLVADEAVSSIVVKLEGESKSRLAGPKIAYNDGRTKKPEVEVHKILYEVKEVFPSEEFKKKTTSTSTAGYTLAPGSHDYPFRFKLPFNNNCASTNSLLSNLNFSGMRMEIAREPGHHVKRTLPPSLSGFPGEAEIRYYVKVTVVRPRFYQENYRAVSVFTFFPIEPPRPNPSDEETYARRAHAFQRDGAAARPKKGLFSALRASTATPPSTEALKVVVDARLPHPPIASCNEPLPLRILIKKISAASQPIYLHSVQVELIAYTSIRAHHLRRTEAGSWVIVSVGSLSKRLDKPDDPADAEYAVDNVYWKSQPLPNTVAPTFETCNISRRYELEIRVGLSPSSSAESKGQPVIVALRHPIEIYSGIAPPPALLEAMAARRSSAQQPAGSDVPNPMRPQTVQPPETPTSPLPPTIGPAKLGEYAPVVSATVGDGGAPPSYEDAIGDDMGPVDGRRRDYDIPDAAFGSAFEKDSAAYGQGSGTDVIRLAQPRRPPSSAGGPPRSS